MTGGEKDAVALLAQAVRNMRRTGKGSTWLVVVMKHTEKRRSEMEIEVSPFRIKAFHEILRFLHKPDLLLSSVERTRPSPAVFSTGRTDLFSGTEENNMTLWWLSSGKIWPDGRGIRRPRLGVERIRAQVLDLDTTGLSPKQAAERAFIELARNPIVWSVTPGSLPLSQGTRRSPSLPKARRG